jgi:serine/threonine-protein kinase
MIEALGQYKILDRIGADGVGEVYRARDTRLGRTVAIKTVSADICGDPDRRRRFTSDAKAAIDLSHPNIAAVYELGEAEGQLFLALEFVPGEPLAAVIAGRPLNARRAIDYGAQIADALADAQAAGMVHGALAADTVVITPKGNAKILDLGLSGWTRSTAAGAASDDLVGLGMILFEMLTGRRADPTVAFRAPSAVNKSAPAELDPIVRKLLGQRPSGRYEAAATVAAELRSVAAILDVRSSAVEPPVLVAPVVAKGLRSRWPLKLMLVIALGMLAWIVWRAFT